MPLIGPASYEFRLDSYDPTTNTTGAPEVLPRITEFSGIKKNRITVSLTHYGATADFMGQIGRVQFDQVVLKGYINSDAGSAYRRIGDDPPRTDMPTRTLTVIHSSGLRESIELILVANNPIPSLDDDTMFEATFENGSGDASDFERVVS